MEKRRITRREILCLLILLALAAALYLHGLQRPTGGTAVIEQDGKTLHRIAFASLSETETLSVKRSAKALSAKTERACAQSSSYFT